MTHRPGILSYGGSEYRGGDELMLKPDYVSPVLYCISKKGADLRCWDNGNRYFCEEEGELRETYKECRESEQRLKESQAEDELEFQKYWYWAYLACPEVL